MTDRTHIDLRKELAQISEEMRLCSCLTHFLEDNAFLVEISESDLHAFANIVTQKLNQSILNLSDVRVSLFGLDE